MLLSMQLSQLGQQLVTSSTLLHDLESLAFLLVQRPVSSLTILIAIEWGLTTFLAVHANIQTLRPSTTVGTFGQLGMSHTPLPVPQVVVFCVVVPYASSIEGRRKHDLVHTVIGASSCL